MLSIQGRVIIMKKIQNVTLCAVAWTEKYIKETYEAYKSFKDKISFEKTIFFVDQLGIIPKSENIEQIKLPDYFSLGETLDIPIVGPVSSKKINPYSLFMIKDIYKYISTDYLLMFQNDGYIRNPDAWEDEFLNYDYIGAPWPWPAYISHPVGNGGFSLRSKRLCQLLGEDQSVPAAAPEDVLICVHLRKALEGKGIRFAPIDVAARFSTEWHSGYTDQFGFHGHWHLKSQ